MSKHQLNVKCLVEGSIHFNFRVDIILLKHQITGIDVHKHQMFGMGSTCKRLAEGWYE